jgi:hypothetical protein
MGMQRTLMPVFIPIIMHLRKAFLRWLALQVHSHPDVPFAHAAEQVTAAARAAISAAGGQYKATLIKHVCIPGCVLFMGHLIAKPEHHHQQQQEQQQQSAPQMPLTDESAGETFFSSSVGQAACSSGVWRVECRATEGSAESVTTTTTTSSSSTDTKSSQLSRSDPRHVLLEYNDIKSLEDATTAGEVRDALQSSFDHPAAAPCSPPAAPAPTGSLMGSGPHCVVTTWDGELQLQLVTHQLRSIDEEHGCVGSLNAGVNSSSIGSSDSTVGFVVRVVVTQGSCVLWDEEVLLQPVGVEGTSLCLRLPMNSICSIDRHSSSNGVAALSLSILPAHDAASRRSSSSSRIPAWEPLARVTVLLLPAAAAAEVQCWVQQHELSQQEVAPLLLDLALLLDTMGSRQVPARTACTAAASAFAMPVDSSDAPAASSTAADGGCQGGGTHCPGSMSANSVLGVHLLVLLGQGLLPCLYAYGWDQCAELVSARVGELLGDLQREASAAVLRGVDAAAAGHGVGAVGAALESAAAYAGGGMVVEGGTAVGEAASKPDGTGVGVKGAGSAAAALEDRESGGRGVTKGLWEEKDIAGGHGKDASTSKGAEKVSGDVAAVRDQREGCEIQHRGRSSEAGAMDTKSSCSSSAPIYKSSVSSGSSSGFKSAGGTQSAAPPAFSAETPVLSAADAAAVAGWGPRALWLCCKGFGYRTEAAYLEYKADFFGIPERSLLVIQLLSLVGFLVKCQSAVPGWFQDPRFLLFAGEFTVKAKCCTINGSEGSALIHMLSVAGIIVAGSSEWRYLCISLG